MFTFIVYGNSLVNSIFNIIYCSYYILIKKSQEIRMLNVFRQFQNYFSIQKKITRQSPKAFWSGGGYTVPYLKLFLES